MFRDEERYRRHKGACPYYREHWVHGEDRTPDGEILLYQVICLKGWPPETGDEQNSCMCSVSRCWRNGESHKVTPEESVGRRESQPA